MADIVSAEITVPLSGFFGTQEYTFDFDPLTATSFTPLVWNSQDITGMQIRWEDVPSFVNDPIWGLLLGGLQFQRGEFDGRFYRLMAGGSSHRGPGWRKHGRAAGAGRRAIGFAKLRLKKCL